MHTVVQLVGSLSHMYTTMHGSENVKFSKLSVILLFTTTAAAATTTTTTTTTNNNIIYQCVRM